MTPGWWVRRPSRERATTRLICVPHGGAGATAYVHWATLVPASWELFIAQLPGRENRVAEAPLTSVAEVVDGLLGSGTSPFELPYVLFGHSYGALVAFELTRALERLERRPLHLVVSGRAGPTVPDLTPPLPLDTDAALIEQLRMFGGTDLAALQHPELLDLVLPALRADLLAARGYVHASGAAVSCGITAFGGTADPEVPERDLREWNAVTRGTFTHEIFPGGHFYLREHASTLVSRIHAIATEAATTQPPA